MRTLIEGKELNFSENTGLLGAELSDATLDRFQKAFDELNQLL